MLSKKDVLLYYPPTSNPEMYEVTAEPQYNFTFVEAWKKAPSIFSRDRKYTGIYKEKRKWLKH